MQLAKKAVVDVLKTSIGPASKPRGDEPLWRFRR